MDHLPRPQEAFRSYPPCPCLCIVVDPAEGDFRVKRSGEYNLDKSSFLRNDNSAQNVCLDDVAPFLQSWLWFELLETIFSIANVPFEQCDFVKRSASGEFCVSTEHLHRYLWYWVAAESQTTITTKAEHRQKINEILQEVYDVLQCFTVTENRLGAPQVESVSVLGSYVVDDQHQTLLQITLLGEILEHAKVVVYGSEGEIIGFDETLTTRKMLLDAGWCINAIAQLNDQFTDCHTSLLLYLASIDHGVYGLDHGNCSLQLCVHSRIDYSTYVPEHVALNCTCPLVRVEGRKMREMLNVLGHGSTPLLKFTNGAAPQDRLVLQEWQSESSKPKYVAISHVWSDKLGNLHENALPHCQIARIQQSVNDLYPQAEEDIPFWMDTLCVPRETSARRLAINGMRRVYQEAERVLVLDNSLRSLTCASPPEECMLRIKIAPWSTRLWTFHESTLARRISFQLKDGAVTGDQLIGKYLVHVGNGPAVVHIGSLTSRGLHAHLNRALCRAMMLRHKGSKFFDMAQDDCSSSEETTSATEEFELKEATSAMEECESEKALSSSEISGIEAADMAMSDNDSADLADEAEFGSSEHMVSRSPALAPVFDEIDRIANEMVEWCADTACIRARLENLRRDLTGVPSDAEALQSDLACADARIRSIEAWADDRDLENIASNAHRAQVRGENEAFIESQNLMPDLHLQHRRQQRCHHAPSIDIPGDWLEEPPTSADQALRLVLNRAQLRDVTPRFWLTGFDPSVTEGLSAYSDLRTLQRRLETEPRDGPSPQDVAEAISGISFRSTSWLDDEAVCLAIILGLDVACVQSCTGAARMRAFASMLVDVPRGLAFSPVPRLDDDGFRWMPRSFLGAGLPNSVTSHRIKEHAYRTARGLCLKAMGVLLEVTSDFVGKSEIIFTIDGLRFGVSIRSAQGFRWLYFVGSRVAVIVEGDLDCANLEYGIIASWTEEEADIVFARFEAFVVIEYRKTESELYESYTVASTGLDRRHAHQQWCIG